jgi:predicted lactoylglutathione lyase
MLFSEPVFANFIKNKICNTQRVHEVLLSIGAESNEEVGGNQDWMYGGVFADLGGHRLNVLHMDMSKIFASR